MNNKVFAAALATSLAMSGSLDAQQMHAEIWTVVDGGRCSFTVNLPTKTTGTGTVKVKRPCDRDLRKINMVSYVNGDKSRILLQIEKRGKKKIVLILRRDENVLSGTSAMGKPVELSIEATF